MIVIRNLFAFAFMLSCCLPCFGATPKLFEKLGSQNIATLTNAKYVTMLLLSSDPKKGPLNEIHLTSDQMERFKKNLLDDHNYDFSKPKYCHFIPELSFKFETDNEILHLFVNLHCSQILFSVGNQSILLNYQPSEQRLSHFFEDLVSEGYAKNKKSFQTKRAF